MDFWKVYEAEKAKQGFGESQLYIKSRDRIHASLSSVDRYGVLLGMNQGTLRKYSPEQRYVMTKDVTHDLFVSVYDVNTTTSALLRFSQPLGQETIRKALSNIKKLKKPNLEMRVIGLQDKDTDLLGSAEQIYRHAKPALIEVDIFGNETRHLVFDLRLGMVFNLFLLNRIYRPHELVTTLSIDDYNSKKSELGFV